MDFKYRPKSWIWDPNPRPAKRPPATNQLISYSNDSKSSWLLGGYLSTTFREQMRPVIEVWGVYPRNTDYSKMDKVEYDETYNVRLVHLSPGVDNDHFKEELAKVIDKVLNFAAKAGFPSL